jgi:hypothetical protein
MSADGGEQRDELTDRKAQAEALGLLLFRGFVAVLGLFLLGTAAVISVSGPQGSVTADPAAVLAGVAFLCGLLFVEAGRRQRAVAGSFKVSGGRAESPARGSRNWPKIVTGLLLALVAINLPYAFEPDRSPALILGLLAFLSLVFALLSGWTPSRMTRIRPEALRPPEPPRPQPPD